MKIAFIAMSGIRACDEELLRLGLTLPGFVERSQTIASLPSLGLLTLAGMTPPEHAVEYIEVDQLSAQPSLIEQLLDRDLIAISTFSAQSLEAYALADQLKAKGFPGSVVMGGIHVTSLPEEALTHCDAVVAGEGELCWHRVLEDGQNRTLTGVYRSQPEEFNMVEAPMPRFDLLDMDRYNRITIQTARGCPHRCEFCASSILLTRKYKQKPIENVLAELDEVRRLWPRPFIEFADDNSFVNRRYWKKLLPELAKRRVRWFTETDISVAEDDELLALMAQAGCVEVLIGLESPVETGMRGLEVLRDWKLRKLPGYATAIHNIQRHGIRVNGCFVFGLDGHTPAIFDRVLEAARAYELYDVQVTLQTPFPGTPLYQRLEQAGRLTHPGQWHRCTLFDLNYEPVGMTADELTTGFRDLVVKLYSQEETDRRRRLFNHQYRRGLPRPAKAS